MRKRDQTPEQRQEQGQHRKVNTIIQSLITNIEEGWITLEELKFITKQVELRLKEKKNGKITQNHKKS
jgi:hypothetical protein